MHASPKKARDVFLAAIKLPVEEREGYLREACGDDQDLHRRVSALLQAQAEIGSFHEAPAVTVDEPITEAPGTVIGPYKLLEQIGEGGMGAVWMAQQTEPVKRLVALKLIKAGMDSKQVIARFEAERQALALMDHPNIAKVLDGGTASSGRPYFVMDLVKGVPITRYCDEHRLTPRQRLELFVPVCQAVQHAHQKGIIHRDLKPSNVLVALYDSKPVPKVIDFGVAKATGQSLTDKTLVTGFGAIVGTLEYMSPEQAEVNQLDIDTRSDIYSLGVLLYELMAGSPPFSRKDLEKAGMLEMLRVIREQEPSKPSTKLSSSDALPTLSANRGTEPAKLTKLVRGELDWIVMKALEKDRNRRYETANGFAMDVQRYLADEAVQACPPSVGYRLRKFARRNKAGLAVAALVLFFLVLLGSGVGWAVRDRSAREADAARQQVERRAKVAGQVESILAEADRLMKEQEWPEALATVRRAEAAVAGGEADAETTEQVRQRLKDLEFIDRLEQIRMEYREHSAGWAERDQDYARAFRDNGVDIAELGIEASIERLKARPAIAIPLAVALDEWLSVRRVISKGDDIGWKRLVAIAHGIDPHPLRDRLRSVSFPLAPKTRDELRALADSIDIRAHHPATLYRLAVALGGDPRLRILRDAQAAYPGDYWLNHELGTALYNAGHKTKVNLDGAIQFYTAAVAVRPSAAKHTDWFLAQILHERGDYDQAIVICRRAIESNPKHRGAPYHRLGLVLRDQKRPDEAIAVYRQAIEARPEDAGRFWRDIGNTLRDQKRPDEAADAYRKALAAHRQAIEATPENASRHASPSSDILLAQGKPDEAIAVYRQAIEARPEDASSFWCAIGNILRDQKKPDEAIAAYRKAIEVDPKNSGASVPLGRILIAQGKPAEAIGVYRKLIAAGPETAGTYLGSIGDVLREQKKLAKAADAYSKAIEFKPNDPFYHHRLGLVLRDQKKLAEANAAFDKAIELYPTTSYASSAYPFYIIGVVRRDQGRLDDAINAFRKAMDIDPTYEWVIPDLADALRARGRPDEAIDVYRKAVQANPTDFELQQKFAAALVQEGKLDEGIDVYRKSIEFAPTSHLAAAAYFKIGQACYRQKRMPEAIGAYYRVIELDPNNLADGAYHNLGIILRDWGKLDEAAAAFQKVLELNRPNSTVSAYIGLSDILRQQNKLDEAIVVFRKIIELKSDSPRSHNALAWILATRPEANLRDPKQAVVLAKRAVELKAEEGMFWNTLGVAQYRAGDWKGAIAALEESMKRRKGGNSFDWFFLAMAHQQLGEKDKARQWHDQAVEWMDKNQPKNEELHRFRAEASELLQVKEKK